MIQDLKDKAMEYQAYLELPAGSDPVDIMHRLEALNVLIAQSGKALADAKYLQDKAISEGIKDVISKESYAMSASTLNTFVKALARDYNYLVNQFDRINAAATHQIDSLRSILSYKKSEMLL